MINGIIELVVFLVVLLIFASLVTYMLTLRVKVNVLADQLAQEVVDKIAITTKLAEFASDNNLSNLEQTDGFIKFLSESRDSAFKYIEDVQLEIKAFMKEVGPVVEAYRAMPNKNLASDKIVNAYDRLIKIMPEEPRPNQ